MFERVILGPQRRKISFTTLGATLGLGGYLGRGWSLHHVDDEALAATSIDLRNFQPQQHCIMLKPNGNHVLFGERAYNDVFRSHIGADAALAFTLYERGQSILQWISEIHEITSMAIAGTLLQGADYEYYGLVLEEGVPGGRWALKFRRLHCDWAGMNMFVYGRR